MPRTPSIIALLLPVTALLAGCGEEEPRVIDVGARVPAVEEALECPDGAKVQTRSMTGDPAAVHPDAVTAVGAWAERVRRRADIPVDGYRVAVEEVGTVLFTYEKDNRPVIAVIVERTEDANGELGWAARSWARCRPR
jgi:hypothetical protein